MYNILSVFLTENVCCRITISIRTVNMLHQAVNKLAEFAEADKSETQGRETCPDIKIYVCVAVV